MHASLVFLQYLFLQDRPVRLGYGHSFAWRLATLLYAPIAYRFAKSVTKPQCKRHRNQRTNLYRSLPARACVSHRCRVRRSRILDSVCRLVFISCFVLGVEYQQIEHPLNLIIGHPLHVSSTLLAVVQISNQSSAEFSRTFSSPNNLLQHFE
jgi:hypothetical protein